MIAKLLTVHGSLVTVLLLVFFDGSTLQLYDDDSCPTLCTCTDRNTHVDCADAGLNHISSLPDGALTLNASYNSFPTFHFHLIPYAHTIRYAYFDYCQIEELSRLAFGNLRDVVLLSLSHNNIGDVFERTFEGLRQLNTIHLSYNNITRLRSDAFSELSLHLLDLSHNPLTHMSIHTLRGATVIGLNLSHCYFTDLSSDIFQPDNNLRHLWLTNNNNKLTLAATIFQQIPLDSVNLSNSQLVDFTFMRHLSAISVDLSGNILENDQRISFSSHNGIQNLHMNAMDITALTRDMFHSLNTVAHLSLSHNNIKRLTNDLFTDMPYLRRLDLSHNSITFYSSTALRHSQIGTLDLSHNSLVEVKSEHFSQLPRLSELDLSHNQIQIISQSFINVLSRMTVNLAYNRWHCNCELRWLRIAYGTQNPLGITQCYTPSMQLFYSKPSSTFKCSVPSFTSVTHNQTVAIGSNVILNCGAESDPPPAVSWQDFRGESFGTDPNVDRTNPRTQAMWGISSIQESHSGLYTCNASNMAGSVSRTIYIHAVNASLLTTAITPASSSSIMTTYVRKTTNQWPADTTDSGDSPDDTSADNSEVTLSPDVDEKRQTKGRLLVISVSTAVTSLVIIAVVLVCVLLCRRKRKREKQRYDVEKRYMYLDLPDNAMTRKNGAAATDRNRRTPTNRHSNTQSADDSTRRLNQSDLEA